MIEKDVTVLCEKVDDITKTGTEQSRADAVAIKRLDYVLLDMQKSSEKRHSENKARFVEGEKRMNEIEKSIYLNEKEMHKVFKTELEKHDDNWRSTLRWYFTFGTGVLCLLVTILKWVWP